MVAKSCATCLLQDRRFGRNVPSRVIGLYGGGVSSESKRSLARETLAYSKWYGNFEQSNAMHVIPSPVTVRSRRRGEPCVEFLAEAEAHLWIVPLALSPKNSSYFKSILSLDEQERAERFRKITDTQRYVAARGSLRSLLGAYLTIEPERLQFSYDALGKPRLVGDVSHTSISFSVSHSGDQGLFGFVRGNKIGVDLERVRADVDVEGLAKRYFSPNEFQRLRALPLDQQSEAFYCAWTRKEAYLKGRGEGLSYGLDRVEVSLAPAEPAMILKAFDDPEASQHWTMHHLLPTPDYVGAAAVEAADIVFRCFRWQPV